VSSPPEKAKTQKERAKEKYSLNAPSKPQDGVQPRKGKNTKRHKHKTHPVRNRNLPPPITCAKQEHMTISAHCCSNPRHWHRSHNPETHDPTPKGTPSSPVLKWIHQEKGLARKFRTWKKNTDLPKKLNAAPRPLVYQKWERRKGGDGWKENPTYHPPPHSERKKPQSVYLNFRKRRKTGETKKARNFEKAKLFLVGLHDHIKKEEEGGGVGDHLGRGRGLTHSFNNQELSPDTTIPNIL